MLAEEVTFRKDFLRQHCILWLLQRQHWGYMKTKSTINSLKDLRNTYEEQRQKENKMGTKGKT